MQILTLLGAFARRGGVFLRGGQDQGREADRVQQDEALQGNLLRRVQGARLGAAGESIVAFVNYQVCLTVSQDQSCKIFLFVGPRPERPEAAGRARDRTAVPGREEPHRRQLRGPDVPREQRQGGEMR